LCTLPVAAQDTGSLGFINDLASKKQATFGDAVIFFAVAADQQSKSFKKNFETLKEMALMKNLDYDSGKPLRRGMVALMAARYMKLRDSLLYNIFDTERYAHRACVAAGIMDAATSEWGPVSGDELIEIMSAVTREKEPEEKIAAVSVKEDLQ